MLGLYVGTSSRHPHFMSIVVVSAFILGALILSACSTSEAPIGGGTYLVTPSSTGTSSAAVSYPVKVFFSKNPDSLNKFDAVFPVDRTSPTSGVATFALQQLIAGPTASEQSAGYFSELKNILTGSSNCSPGAPDFTLALDKKGTVSETGTATVQFCRATSSPGVGADARITAEINATLKQFPTIKKVVILTTAGHCFGDESGQDHCLK